jgi:hypothetical protein
MEITRRRIEPGLDAERLAFGQLPTQVVFLDQLLDTALNHLEIRFMSH